VKADVAARAKAERLEAQVESALSAGALDRAGPLLSELQGMKAASTRLSDLQKRYESMAGEKETIDRYAHAKADYEEALRHQGTEGFSEKQKEMTVQWNAAEAARQSRSWSIALPAYDEVIARAAKLNAASEARESASRAGAASRAAQIKARGAGAEEDAEPLYNRAVSEAEAGDKAFAAGDFAGASKAWTKAAQTFQSSETRAEAAQAWKAAQREYESALAEADAVLLERYGGESWKQVKRLADQGSASRAFPSDGEAAYRQALEKLPGALQAAAEAERAARLAAALRRARTARDAEQWQNCLDAAGDALAIESGNREAAQLREQAEQNLVPIIAIATTVDGRPVPATISVAGKTFEAPLRSKLKEGQNYTLSFSYERGGRKYRAADLTLNADWKGERKRTVALEEQKLPPDLEEVAGASLAPLSGLAAGSREAQEEQKSAVSELGLPLEVRSKKTGMRFRLIPAGTFTMGSPSGETGRDDDERQHQVTLTEPFYCGMYAVTQGQWKRVMGSNPSHFDEVGDDAPVEMVSWEECVEFCDKLCDLEGVPRGTYRLLTEAQWEYACRAGTTTALCSGELTSSSGRCRNLDRVAWYDETSSGKTHPVGGKAANAWGLYDMHGNVWEWCADWYDSDYPSGSVRDPSGPGSGSYRVYRGGSWYDIARLCRSALRLRFTPGYRSYILGLRLLRTAPSTR